MPVFFEENIGQSSAEISFLGRGRGWTAAFERDGFRLRQAGRNWKVQFQGAATAVRLEGEDRLGAVTNYYEGPTRRDWTLNVPLHQRVAYRGVYPGVDAVFYQRDGLLEYDFEIAPHADPAVIRVTVGAAAARITEGGDLALELDGAELRQTPPRAYQTVDDAEVDVPVSYALEASGAVRFELGAYDRSIPLIIDPLVYSTYLGGTGFDSVDSIGTDPSGAVYLAGRTDSLDFPTTLPITGNATSYLFLTKIDPGKSGVDSVLYSAFFAMPEDTQVVFPGSGLAYFAGRGWWVEPEGPLPDPDQAVQPERAGLTDAHLMIVDPAQDPTGAITYTTYLGGSGTDLIETLKVSDEGKVLLTGGGESVDFPLTENAIDRDCGANGSLSKQWAAVIDPAIPGRDGLLFSSCLGSFPRSDRARSFWEFDAEGRVHFSFSVWRQAIVTPTAFQALPMCEFCPSVYYGLIDPLAGPGEALAYGTHFGGSIRETVEALAVDEQGRAWVAGSTESGRFPRTVDAIGPLCHDNDPVCERLSGPSFFIIGFDAAETGDQSRIFSTVVGGLGREDFGGLLAKNGRVVLFGESSSRELPTTEDAYQTELCDPTAEACFARRSLLIAELRPFEDNPLAYLTRLGSSEDSSLILGPSDYRFVDWYGDEIVAMATVRPSFPTTDGAVEKAPSGAFLAELALFTFDTRRSGAGGLTYSTMLGTDDGVSEIGENVLSVRTAKVAGNRILLGGSTTETRLLTTPQALPRLCREPTMDDPRVRCGLDGFAMVVEPRDGVALELSSDVVEFAYRVPDAPPDPIEVSVSTDDPQLRVRIQASQGRDTLNPPYFDLISVEPRELTGSGSFLITPDVRFLVPGQQYEARILLDSEDPATRRSVLVRIQAEAVEPPEIGAVVSAADFEVGPIAPNQIVTVFGQNLGSLAGNQTTSGGGGYFEDPIGITAQIGSSRAPVLFARHDQVNLVAPAFLEGPTATFTIQTFAGTASIEIPVAVSNPGLFTLNGTGVGPAAALNQDASINTAQNPAAPGSVVVLYGTGEGATSPIRSDGPAVAPLPKPILPVAVAIGGRSAEVLYAGAAPGFIGLFQINAVVPDETPANEATPVVVTVGPNSSRADVTLAIGTN